MTQKIDQNDYFFRHKLILSYFNFFFLLNNIRKIILFEFILIFLIRKYFLFLTKKKFLTLR